MDIIREITPLSEKDCFYIVDRRKTEFTYPIHCHSEYELNFIEHAPGVRRVVGDSAEVIGEYELVLITGKELEHVWEHIRFFAHKTPPIILKAVRTRRDASPSRTNECLRT